MSLAFDFVMLFLFYEVSVFNWVNSIPAFIVMYDYLPDFIQEFFFNFAKA